MAVMAGSSLGHSNLHGYGLLGGFNKAMSERGRGNITPIRAMAMYMTQKKQMRRMRKMRRLAMMNHGNNLFE